MYICCHRAGKAKDLYSRSFLLDEKTSRKDGRVAREKGRIEKEGEGRRERKTERSCIGRARRGLSREWQKERKDYCGTEKGKGRKVENAPKKMDGGEEEGGGGRSAALGERAG